VSQGADHGHWSEREIAKIAIAITIRWHSAVAAIKMSNGWQPHRGCRPARHDHAPDLGDTTTNIEEPALEPIRQIDLRPAP
jgi:hypothetical protein